MIEVRIRALLMSDKGMSVVPSTTLAGLAAPTALDVAQIADKLVAELDTDLLGNLRPMTEAEAETYCAKEEAEEADGYSDLGLSDADDEESGG